MADSLRSIQLYYFLPENSNREMTEAFRMAVEIGFSGIWHKKSK
jgi:hypothetical protein